MAEHDPTLSYTATIRHTPHPTGHSGPDGLYPSGNQRESLHFLHFAAQHRSTTATFAARDWTRAAHDARLA